MVTSPAQRLLERLHAVPVVGILRGGPDRYVLPALVAVADAGVEVLEVTMDTPGAAGTIAAARDALGERALLGAGTVTDDHRFSDAVAAGAQFVVSPTADEELVERASAHGIAAVPGGLTPTEIAACARWRPAMVKLFPAGPLGPGYVRSLRGPLGDVPLLVTGGVGADAVGFLEAGALAVGVGTEVFVPDLLGVGDVEEIGRRANTLVATLSARTRRGG